MTVVRASSRDPSGITATDLINFNTIPRQQQIKPELHRFPSIPTSFMVRPRIAGPVSLEVKQEREAAAGPLALVKRSDTSPPSPEIFSQTKTEIFSSSPSPHPLPGLEQSRRTQICETAAKILYSNSQWVKLVPAFSLLVASDQELLYRHCWRPLFLTSCSSRLSLSEVSLLSQSSPSLSSSEVALFLSSVSRLQAAALTDTESGYLRNAVIFMPRPLLSLKMEASKEMMDILGHQALSLAQAVLGAGRFTEIMTIINNIADSLSSDFLHKLFFKDVIEEDISLDVIVIDMFKNMSH